MQAQSRRGPGPGDFEAAFAAIRSANTQSILLPPEPLILSKREAIAGFAQTHGCRWPSSASAAFFRQAV